MMAIGISQVLVSNACVQQQHTGLLHNGPQADSTSQS
jgi:hypothetical protein